MEESNIEYIDTIDGFRFEKENGSFTLIAYLGNEDTITLPGDINGIIYKDGTVNVLKYTETKVKKGKGITTTFEWITSIEITEKNAVKLAGAGRKRWKIENQGFNRQKRWQGNIEHAYSHNANAQKCHYLMEQIADFIKQLYEYFFLNKNEIKKKQKRNKKIYPLIC